MPARTKGRARHPSSSPFVSPTRASRKQGMFENLRTQQDSESAFDKTADYTVVTWDQKKDHGSWHNFIRGEWTEMVSGLDLTTKWLLEPATDVHARTLDLENPSRLTGKHVLRIIVTDVRAIEDGDQDAEVIQTRRAIEELELTLREAENDGKQSEETTKLLYDQELHLNHVRQKKMQIRVREFWALVEPQSTFFIVLPDANGVKTAVMFFLGSMSYLRMKLHYKPPVLPLFLHETKVACVVSVEP